MNTYKLLQIVANRDILGTYLTVKGGIYDRNGRIHFTRGGCTENAPTCRHGETDAETRQDARIQDWQSVAYQAIRIGEVATGAQESANLTKLVFLPATPRLLPLVCFQHQSGSNPMVTLPVCNVQHGGQASQMPLHAFV